MKSPVVTFLFLVALGCGLASARAQDDSGSLVAQLFGDLTAISADPGATDAQHQALVTDLDALAAGIFSPDPADVDQLATDLGAAAAAGLITSDVETELAADFSVDPDDPDDQDGWLDDIEDDVTYLLRPLDLTDPIATIDPTVVYLDSAGGLVIPGSYTRAVRPLTAQGIPPFLLENYAGSVRLSTRQVAGGPVVARLTVNTNGLPPSNPYQVSITRRSDGTTLVIGKLRVRNDFLYPIAVTLAAQPAAEILTSGQATFGGVNARKALPAGFDPDDVASVTLTDSQGVVRLSGAVAGAPPDRQVNGVTLRLVPDATPGTFSPAFANAFVRHAVSGGGTTDRFHLSARHLPASATVTLLVNGVAAGQYPTTGKGRLVIADGVMPAAPSTLMVYPLPAGVDLSAVKSLAIVDAEGHVLVSGQL